MKGERQVAGLWCSEVLARIYDFLDDQLAPDERARVEEHLAGCSVCASFGGKAAAVAAAVRARLSDPPPVSADLEQRLLGLTDDDPAS
jgi:anti-sigma factor RsiW